MRVISKEEYDIVIGKMHEIDVVLDLVLNDQLQVQQDLEAKILTFYSKIENMFKRDMTKQEEEVLKLVKSEFVEMFYITTKRRGEIS